MPAWVSTASGIPLYDLAALCSTATTTQIENDAARTAVGDDTFEVRVQRPDLVLLCRAVAGVLAHPDSVLSQAVWQHMPDADTPAGLAAAGYTQGVNRIVAIVALVAPTLPVALATAVHILVQRIPLVYARALAGAHAVAESLLGLVDAAAPSLKLALHTSNSNVPQARLRTLGFPRVLSMYGMYSPAVAVAQLWGEFLKSGFGLVGVAVVAELVLYEDELTSSATSETCLQRLAMPQRLVLDAAALLRSMRTVLPRVSPELLTCLHAAVGDSVATAEPDPSTPTHSPDADADSELRALQAALRLPGRATTGAAASAATAAVPRAGAAPAASSPSSTPKSPQVKSHAVRRVMQRRAGASGKTAGPRPVAARRASTTFDGASKLMAWVSKNQHGPLPPGAKAGRPGKSPTGASAGRTSSFERATAQAAARVAGSSSVPTSTKQRPTSAHTEIDPAGTSRRSSGASRSIAFPAGRSRVKQRSAGRAGTLPNPRTASVATPHGQGNAPGQLGVQAHRQSASVGGAMASMLPKDWAAALDRVQLSPADAPALLRQAHTMDMQSANGSLRHGVQHSARPGGRDRATAGSARAARPPQPTTPPTSPPTGFESGRGFDGVSPGRAGQVRTSPEGTRAVYNAVLPPAAASTPSHSPAAPPQHARSESWVQLGRSNRGTPLVYGRESVAPVLSADERRSPAALAAAFHRARAAVPTGR